MDRRLSLAATAAAAHLAIVGLGALRVDLGAAGILGRAAARYAAITGAGSAHGFFGPDFAPEPRATFEVARRDGSVIPASLDPSARGEADARLSGMVTGSMLGDRVSCRAVAASCAGKILGRHPEAESVVVRLATYDLPTMTDLRRGAAPGWRVLYEARFAPAARPE